jgi:hypothetical protein
MELLGVRKLDPVMALAEEDRIDFTPFKTSFVEP